jgi:hypothetical protein
MFETAVQEKRTGMLWGVIVAFAACSAARRWIHAYQLIQWAGTGNKQ